jgi:DNA-binding transcriptional LysR family regulator
MIDSVLDEHGVAMPSSIEVGGCQAVMQFVRLRLGLGLVHNICACAEPHDDLDLIDVSEQFGKLDVALAIRSETLLSPSHQALIRTLSNGADADHTGHG